MGRSPRRNLISIYKKLRHPTINCFRKNKEMMSFSRPDLIKEKDVDWASMIWQSGITCIPIENRHYNAIFILDIYTKKIVGYKVSNNLRAKANMDALKMSLCENGAPEIHHRNRGNQCTYEGGIDLLRENGAKGPIGTDDAYAGHTNKTIKEEYFYH